MNLDWYFGHPTRGDNISEITFELSVGS